MQGLEKQGGAFQMEVGSTGSNRGSYAGIENISVLLKWRVLTA